MSQLQQINEMIKIAENIQKIDAQLELIEAKAAAWQEGFKTAKQIYCPHLEKTEVSDESSAIEICMDCGKET